MEYFINDLSRFIEASRVLVYSLFGSDSDTSNIVLSMKNLSKEQKQEINSCLTQKEAGIIAIEFLIKSQEGYSISETSYNKFLDSLMSRLTSNLLAKMVSQGELETAFDDESGEFIFWTKESDD